MDTLTTREIERLHIDRAFLRDPALADSAIDRLLSRVEELQARCAAMREALADLLTLYYVMHPRGSDIRDASDEELEKRMKWLGPHIFRVGPVLAARRALREWEAVRG